MRGEVEEAQGDLEQGEGGLQRTASSMSTLCHLLLLMPLHQGQFPEHCMGFMHTISWWYYLKLKKKKIKQENSRKHWENEQGLSLSLIFVGGRTMADRI